MSSDKKKKKKKEKEEKSVWAAEIMRFMENSMKAAMDADNGGDHGSIQTGSQRSFESTGTAGNSQAGAGRRKLYYGGPGYLADRTFIHTF